MRLSFLLAFVALGWHNENSSQGVKNVNVFFAEAIEMENDGECKMEECSYQSQSSDFNNTTISNQSTVNVDNHNAYRETETETEAEAHNQDRDNRQCNLYLAESSIPNSGLGVYTTRPLSKGDILPNRDLVFYFQEYNHNQIMIAIFPTEKDMQEWNQVTAGLIIDSDVVSCARWAKSGECSENPSYMLENCARSCAVQEAGLDVDKLIGASMSEYSFNWRDTDSDCRNLAERGECTLNDNYMMEYCADSCAAEKFGLWYYLDHGTLTESTLGNYVWNTITYHDGLFANQLVPGIGAASNSHFGLHNIKMTGPPSIDSAGYHRSKDAGVGAFSSFHDFKITAGRDIEAGMELFANYGQGYFTGEGREKEFGEVPFEEHYKEADSLMDTFWKDIADRSGSDIEAEKMYQQVLDSVSEPRVKKLMPSSFQKAKASKGVSSAMFSTPTAVRSKDWLKQNGMCIDNMYAAQSTISQAGRGAFASRNLKQGQTISPMPTIAIHKQFLRQFQGEQEVIKAQAFNYVYGHEKSSIALLPYSPIVNFVNNHEDKSRVNARIQWSTSPYHDKSWEAQSAEYIISQRRVGLIMDLVATKDIEKDDEIFIDYGKSWDEAWADHIDHWEPSSTSEDYTPIGELNARKELQTEEEQESVPLGSNVNIMCSLNLDGLIYDINHGERTFKWKDYAVDTDTLEGSESDQSFCGIDRRSRVEDSDSKESVYRIYLEGEGGRRLYVDDVPREAIKFFSKPFTSDGDLNNAFRHYIHVPDGMFPAPWMDLN